MSKRMPTPGWVTRYQRAKTPDERLTAAYDGVRAAMSRLRRARTTPERGGLFSRPSARAAANAAARAYEIEACVRADELGDSLAEQMINTAYAFYKEDWERQYASGHDGQSRRGSGYAAPGAHRVAR